MTPTQGPPSHFQRAHRWLRQRTDVKVLLPSIATLGLLAYVSVLAVAPESGDQLLAIVERTWWIALLLTVPYIGARALLWRELLEQLDVNVSWRLTVAALAGGEIAKIIPGGVYFQNYLLARACGLHERAIVRSSTATTATLALESALALPLALIIGIPGLSWLSWALLGIVGVWLLLLVLLYVAVHYWELHLAPGTPHWLRRLAKIAQELLDATAELWTWRTVRAAVPTAIYMLIYIGDLYLIALAAGVDNVGPIEVSAIYAVVVLTVILIPIPVKVGTTELSGLSAFVAYGVSRPTAAVIMLALRLLTTGATMLLAAILLVALHQELFRPGTPAQAAAPPVEPGPPSRRR